MSGLLPLPSDSPNRVGPLTKSESAALAVCEAVIEESLGAWVNVTNAFLEIAEHGLYRETHPTFEAYCADKWGISRSHGHRLVLLGRVGMSPVGDKIRNERQAREVASLLDNPELLLAVVARAEEIRKGKPLTAAALRQARAELTLPPDQAALAREVYEVAEWTQEALFAWEQRAVDAAARYVKSLPPGEWGWGHAQMQSRKTEPQEALTSMASLLALDAPLTYNVCQILLEARAEIVGYFHKQIEAFQMMARAGAHIEASPIPLMAEAGGPLRTACMQMAGSLSSRMAEVLVAVAEMEEMEPAPWLPEWTPEKIEQAKADWVEQVAELREQSKITLWPFGPLGDEVVASKNSLLSFRDALRDLLKRTEE